MTSPIRQRGEGIHGEGPCQGLRVLLEAHGGHIQAIHGRATHQTEDMPPIERAPAVIFATHRDGNYCATGVTERH